MCKNTRTIVALIIVISSIFVAARELMNKTPPHSLKIWTRFQPYSLDPLEYDYDVHHLVMRSVMASLITLYKEGEVSPQIAKAWNSKENFKRWEITIDPKWKFSNGEFVTPQIVLQSFKRVLYIKRKENSSSGLLEHINGFSNFKNINDEVPGLYIENNLVIFEFNKSIPDFLDKISFGLYAIAHPKDYDSEGKWIDAKKGITSGKYKVKTWNSDSIEIELTAPSEKNYNLIKFHSSKELEEIRSSDIVFFDQKNPYINKEEWEYVSKTQNNAILYVQVMNWDQPNTFFSNRQNRQNLRDQYYDQLKNSGYKVTKSFFPLEINNITEFSSEGSNQPIKLDELRTQPFIYNENFFKVGVIERGKFFKDAFENLTSLHNIKPTYNEYPEQRSDEKKVFDIQFLGTSILIDNPREDIEFMFKSKHGINLPDEDGQITALLNDKDFNIQEINKKLWDQAIIWPITHSSSGMWVKKQSKVNFQSMNPSIHPLDAQFIYWK